MASLASPFNTKAAAAGQAAAAPAGLSVESMFGQIMEAVQKSVGPSPLARVLPYLILEMQHAEIAELRQECSDLRIQNSSLERQLRESLVRLSSQCSIITVSNAILEQHAHRYPSWFPDADDPRLAQLAAQDAVPVCQRDPGARDAADRGGGRRDARDRDEPRAARRALAGTSVPSPLPRP